jgi:hypothetical protein
MSINCSTYLRMVLAFAVGTLALTPSVADAQIGVQQIEVQHWAPEIHVVVTQNGVFDCERIRAINDEQHFMYLKPEVGTNDYSNYRFQCGPIQFDYFVNLVVLDVQVVDGQTRPTVIQYATYVNVVDTAVSLLEDIRRYQVSEGEWLVEQGAGKPGVPGIIFYGSRDATTWTFF